MGTYASHEKGGGGGGWQLQCNLVVYYARRWGGVGVELGMKIFEVLRWSIVYKQKGWETLC